MNVDDWLYCAVDLGAGSGRVFLGGFGPGELLVEEVHRFRYPPRVADGHLRWDAARILEEITAGLRSAAERARSHHRAVRSVGVDSWGVDYGLVDAAGRLVEDPICYRDARTDGMMDAAFDLVPRDEIFARTGIQVLALNTLFQLLAHAREGIPPAASRLLLMPDLVHAHLTGRAVTEYSNATTTQLVSAETRTWDAALVERLGLPGHLLCPIVRSGEELGPLAPDVAAETGLESVTVVAPATHDTGSAVAGAPLQPGWAYISSGTWSLVGVERARPLVNGDVARENFTNEGGVYGTTRFLKNVTGMWILESCRREWLERGETADYDRLVSGAAVLDGPKGQIFPDDPRFNNPLSMLAAITAQMVETGQSMPDAPAEVTRVILDSLAQRYASVLRTIEDLTGEPITGVQIVGGGSQNAYLNQATANATGKPVLAGPTEATVIGNLLVQAIAAGRFASLAEARRHVAGHVHPEEYSIGTSFNCCHGEN